MIKTSQRNIHWDYYLGLEADVMNVARYIEFDKSNFETHSIELSQLLLASSSEVDVVMKGLCRLIDPDEKAKNIYGYKKVVKKHLPNIPSQEVKSSRYELVLKPWTNWEGDKNPDWWLSYNKVKHERTEHYKKANLQNVLNSVAGLLVANIHYNHALFCSEHEGFPYDLRDSIRNLSPSASLFRLNDPFLYYVE